MAIILETLAGRCRVVLNEKPGAVAVSVWDRGAVFASSIKVRPCGKLIRSETIRGDFSKVAGRVLAEAQALEDEMLHVEREAK